MQSSPRCRVCGIRLDRGHGLDGLLFQMLVRVTGGIALALAFATASGAFHFLFADPHSREAFTLAEALSGAKVALVVFTAGLLGASVVYWLVFHRLWRNEHRHGFSVICASTLAGSWVWVTRPATGLLPSASQVVFGAILSFTVVSLVCAFGDWRTHIHDFWRLERRASRFGPDRARAGH